MNLSKHLFFATAAATTVFVITILAMIAMLVGDSETPVNLWFNANGAIVMTIEVIAIGVLGTAAIAVDRKDTLREFREKSKNYEQRHIEKSEAKDPPKP